MSENNLNKQTDKEPKVLNKYVGILILLLVVGLVFYAFVLPLITGTSSLINRTYISSTGKIATATIESYEKIPHTRKGGNVTYTYIPKLIFNIDGYTISSSSDFNEVSETLAPIGSTVSIRYDASNPTKCVITNSNFNNNALYQYFFFGIFIGFFIISKIIDRKSKKYETTSKVKGLLRLCIITALLLAILIGFIVWEAITGQLTAASNIVVSILILIFIGIDIKLLNKLVKLYIRNTSRNYLV